MADYRCEKLATLIQQKISAFILDGRIKDPRVTPFLSVTRVIVSRDLSFADVYISNIKADADISKGALGLQNAAGFIQTQLGAVMKIRKIPHLRFHADNSVREGFDIIKKIENLNDK